MIDLIIRNGKIVTHNNERVADIAIKNGKIFKIGKLANLKSKKTIDAKGLHVLAVEIGKIQAQIDRADENGEWGPYPFD